MEAVPQSESFVKVCVELAKANQYRAHPETRKLLTGFKQSESHVGNGFPRDGKAEPPTSGQGGKL